MTYLGLTIITSRSNLDLQAYGGAGVFRKTSISKRTDTINNLGTSSLGHEVPISFQKRHLFFFYTSDSISYSICIQSKPKKTTVSLISILRAKGLFHVNRIKLKITKRISGYRGAIIHCFYNQTNYSVPLNNVWVSGDDYQHSQNSTYNFPKYLTTNSPTIERKPY